MYMAMSWQSQAGIVKVLCCIKYNNKLPPEPGLWTVGFGCRKGRLEVLLVTHSLYKTLT